MHIKFIFILAIKSFWLRLLTKLTWKPKLRLPLHLCHLFLGSRRNLKTMKDRDFIFPFPPWRLILPFFIVFLLNMILFIIFVSSLEKIFQLKPAYSIISILLGTCFFSSFYIGILFGRWVWYQSLKVLIAIMVLISTVFLFFNDDNTLNLIMLSCSLISFLTVLSRYYSGLVYYRSKHVEVINKIKKG